MGTYEEERARERGANGGSYDGSYNDRRSYDIYSYEKTAADFKRNTAWTPIEYLQSPVYNDYQSTHVELTYEQQVKLARLRTEQAKVNAELSRIKRKVLWKNTRMTLCLVFGGITAITALIFILAWVKNLSKILKKNPEIVWVAPAMTIALVLISIFLFRSYLKLIRPRV